MHSRTLFDILFLIWGQTVADYKMLSFHLSINVIIIVVSFKVLDLCPIALFQQLWNTLYPVQIPCVFTVPCVSHNFTAHHEIKARRALGLPYAKIVYIKHSRPLCWQFRRLKRWNFALLFTWKTNAMSQTRVIQQAIADWLFTSAHSNSSASW